MFIPSAKLINLCIEKLVIFTDAFKVQQNQGMRSIQLYFLVTALSACLPEGGALSHWAF